MVFLKINELCEKHAALMNACADFAWKNPETGYREYKTSEYMEGEFLKLGYTVKRAENIPGFYADFDTGKDGPRLLVLAELDALIASGHTCAVEGKAHACGHNAQLGAIVGVAAALKDENLTRDLVGSVRLCCVPAEEMIEGEYRRELIKEGKIKYQTGKREFLHRGYFDGCDIAILVHASEAFAVTRGNVGSIFKTVNYKGVPAHAGACPELGVNALYAANLGLSAVNAVRETFVDEDGLKFHAIITHGGESANIIPDKISLEAYVRGKDVSSILSVNKRINRALTGAALAMGASVKIEDFVSYFPLNCDGLLSDTVIEAAQHVIPEENILLIDKHTPGSTDLGDLSALIPAVHPFSAGISGAVHGNDFYIKDSERAVIKSAKLQLATVVLLLSNNAERAKKIIDGFNPKFKNKEELFALVDDVSKKDVHIEYKGENEARAVF